MHTTIEDIGSDRLPALGRPFPNRKMSISKVDPAFSEEVQADLFFCKIGSRRHVGLHTVYVSMTYSETITVPSRSAVVVIHSIERVWIMSHGALRSLASDAELHTRPLKRFLSIHSIHLQ